MKLLFKTTGTGGSTELKELLGFLDVDLKFSKLLPDLKTSTKDVIKLIGNDIYDIVVAAYEETTISDEDRELIYAVRYPIAINAYSLYAPSGDVAHTNNGRKMRQDDNEKLPFEWLLDRADKALEIRYYRALDDMIEHLDHTDDIELKEMWEATETFKTSRGLFVYSTHLFDKIMPIQSRLLYLKLAPGLKDCEDYQIKPLIGKLKFDELKATIKSNTEFTDEKDIELIQLIHRASVFHAMAWAMPRYSVNLYPEGVLQYYTSDQNTTKGGKPSLKTEVIEAKQAFEKDAKNALEAIKQFITPPPIIETEPCLLPKQMFGDTYFSA